jgi:thiol-disulfide isomerase/thioredoxin
MSDDQKGRLFRTVEFAAHLAIIAIAFLLALVVIRNYLFHPSVPPASDVKQSSVPRDKETRAGPIEGTSLSVPGINWAESKQTIVLALSDKCHFCSESAPFYQRLSRELGARKDVRVIAVFPQNVDEGKKYLDGLGVPVEQVRQATLDSIGVRGTPTLIIVDATGVVKQSWVGRLNAERESEVLGRIRI